MFFNNLSAEIYTFSPESQKIIDFVLKKSSLFSIRKINNLKRKVNT